jgi:hypothetical protein
LKKKVHAMTTPAKVLFSLLIPATVLFGQYSTKPGGAPPSEIGPEISAMLQKQGTAIVSNGQPYAEIWFSAEAPKGPDTSEQDVSWKSVPHGSLLGVIRYAAEGKDRRGQKVKPGLYTLRFSYYPVDGAHQGVESTRDFLVLSPADGDKDPKATPAFAPLMDMSRKASGGRHPLVLTIWKAGSEWQEGLAQQGEDWVLGTKIGGETVMVIVSGINEHDR